MNIGILILAAGSSQRFGGDKRRAPLADGTPLLIATTRNALASGLPVAVCLRPDETELAVALEKAGTQVLYCPGAAAGMGHTLADAIAQVDWQGALVALGDMPYIEPATYCKAAAALLPGGICQPTWHGRPGHPVGFDRHWFPRLRQLRGDTGARDILAENRGAVTRFPVDDPGILRDIDTPQDIESP